MTHPNALLARFDGVPNLVSHEMQGIFEASLHKASTLLTRIESASDQPVMSDDFWFASDDWRSAFRPYVVKDGILHIPVKGVLLDDLTYSFGSYATGYPYISKAFERGLVDREVKGIALIVDSPGGAVAGNFDLADKIYKSRGEKPIRAFVHESAYSAAYSIASAADSIVVSRTGGVGSIGVVTAHVDVSKAIENEGVKITFIHAGKHKVDGNPYEALPPEVRLRIQTRIDELMTIFVTTVARNRAMSEQAVRDTEALMFTANQAVSNGLADTIGSLDDAVATFVADLSLDEGDLKMSGQTQNPAVEQAAIETARTEGFTAGKLEGLAEGRAEGMAAQAERINAIINSEEGKKRPTAALAAALDTDMSAEQAENFLSKLAEEKAQVVEEDGDNANAFEKAMNATGHIDLGKGGDEPAQPSRLERAMRTAGKAPKSA